MVKGVVPDRWKGTLAEPYWQNEKKCRALVKKVGSIRGAARTIGVRSQTFTLWYDPKYAARQIKLNRERRTDKEYVERRNKLQRERYANDAEYAEHRRKQAFTSWRKRYMTDPTFRAKSRLRSTVWKRKKRITNDLRKLELLNEEFQRCAESLMSK